MPIIRLTNDDLFKYCLALGTNTNSFRNIVLNIRNVVNLIKFHINNSYIFHRVY